MERFVDKNKQLAVLKSDFITDDVEILLIEYLDSEIQDKFDNRFAVMLIIDSKLHIEKDREYYINFETKDNVDKKMCPRLCKIIDYQLRYVDENISMTERQYYYIKLTDYSLNEAENRFYRYLKKDFFSFNNTIEKFVKNWICVGE